MQAEKEFLTDKRILVLTAMEIIYILGSLLSPYHAMDAVWLLFGLLFFFIAESLIHRYILHGKLAGFLPNALHGHHLHHQDPTNIAYLLTPVPYILFPHLLLAGIFFAASESLHAASLMLAGTGLYHLFYEWTHFVSHRPIKPLTPWGRRMKKFHLLHHYRSEEHWFGVTHAAMDVVMGTHTPPASFADRIPDDSKPSSDSAV